MLVEEVERAVVEFELPGRGLLVAASAGIDSTALLHSLLEIALRNSLKLSVAHVNHGLRGADSEADEAAVRQLADDRSLPVFVRRVDPEVLRSGVSSRARPTLQEAARTLRYSALREMAAEAGCRHLATAHNADDQAETVLLRLFRGAGPDGLAGIPPRSRDGVVVRPLLRVPRSEIETFAEERGLHWREDRSNDSVAYTRNRLRLRWLPGLADEFNPRLLRAIGDLAEAQRRDSEWIATLVEHEAPAWFALEDGWLRVRKEDWGCVPEALARRLVRWGLRECGGARDTTRVHLERMLEFLRTGQPGTHIELPGGLRLERGSAGLRLGPIAGTEGPVGPGPAC